MILYQDQENKSSRRDVVQRRFRRESKTFQDFYRGLFESCSVSKMSGIVWLLSVDSAQHATLATVSTSEHFLSDLRT